MFINNNMSESDTTPTTYGELCDANIMEKRIYGAKSLAKKNLKYSFKEDKVTFKKFRASYSKSTQSSNWLGRKVLALPAAFFDILKFIFHLEHHFSQSLRLIRNNQRLTFIPLQEI